MTILNTTNFRARCLMTGLAVGVLTGAVAAVPSPQLAERDDRVRDSEGRRDKAPPSTNERANGQPGYGANDQNRYYADYEGRYRDGDGTSILNAMNQNGTSLVDAIQAAERQLNGKAIEARCRHGMGDTAAPMMDVTVVDNNGKMSVAMIDMTTGKVASTRAAGMTDGREMARDGRSRTDWNDGRNDRTARDASANGIAKASECIGKDVYDVNNRKIGDVDEIAIDEGRGRVAYVIVDLDGSIDRNIIVPWTAFRPASDDRIVLNTDVRLESAPEYRATSWKDMHTETYGRPISEYYHTTLYGTDDRTGDRVGEGMVTDSKDGKSRDETKANAKSMGMIKLSDVLGMNIKGASGEALGEIEDLVLDPSNGKISYAVLSFGGFLGFNDKLFAVPWTSLSARKDGSVVFPVTKERLERAPGFDKNNWPTMANQTFTNEVDSYYRNRTAGVTE